MHYDTSEQLRERVEKFTLHFGCFEHVSVFWKRSLHTVVDTLRYVVIKFIEEHILALY